ncbi:MAG: extracellular solute-binding protein [Clostridia bacterium]|nr:extracellular solute-binding protein [Clostridia bacterium]
MKKSVFQRIICLILCVTTLFSVVVVGASAGVNKPETTAASLKEMQQLVGTTTYAEYLETIPESKEGLTTIVIDNSTVTGSAVKVLESTECQNSMMEKPDAWAQFGDNAENSLYLPSTGEATWSVVIPESAAGRYYIRITYFNCETSESSISSIERKLFINGEIPFAEAGHLNLTKYWKYETLLSSTSKASSEKDFYDVEYYTEKGGENPGYFKKVVKIEDGIETVEVYQIHQDINGNSMAPDITQLSKWGVYYCQDTTGYYHDYFSFYLESGYRTITLAAERDPVIVKSIELVPADDEASTLKSYNDVLAEYKANGYETAKDGEITHIQAEFPDFVSDSSVAATNDNTSASTFPSVSNAQLYNVIGENSYNTVGQWAAYKFTVNSTGLYKLGMRYKQDALQGMYICRSIKLAGGQYGLSNGTPTAPFEEAYNAQFNYDKAWQSTFVGDYIYLDKDGNEVDITGYRVNSDGEYTDLDGNVVDIERKDRPFEFYFEEGVEYTLYLECSLGSLKDLIRRVQNSLDNINSHYLRILQLTGNDPDEYRDYDFYGIMPEVVRGLLEEAIELEAVKQEFETLCGTTGSHITTLHTIALLLNTMGEEYGDAIAANMTTLKSYLGTLGTWINNSKRSSMIVDSISICPADKDEDDLPRGDAGFFRSIGFELSSFFYSFFTEYDQMGLTTIPDEDTVTIDVWLATGRDQSQIWRTMIDAKGSFTENTGVAVTLKLVTGGTLLPSILSGKGPDVYIGLGSTDVINYAIRKAVYGVSGNDPYLDGIKINSNTGAPASALDKDAVSANELFSNNYFTYCKEVKNGDKIEKVYTTSKTYKGEECADGKLTFKSLTYDEVIADNFVPAAMDTVILRNKCYGIPQTMSFAMMFYRMDVLANLGQEVPETWGELLSLLPVLQTNNMSIGLTYGSALNFMIYQMGGNMWKFTDNPDYAGAKIGLDTNVAKEAFDYVCRLYSDYSFPVTFDAANRFRTGEMPLIIGDYATIYNQLVVYATEIAGMWEFTSLPGYKNEQTGYYNYDSLAGIGATVILNGCDNLLAAWQFLQWQTSESVQSNYGNRMVALIGPSAKYESANVKALKNMSWTASEYEAIELQMNHLSSIVNYPGSYIIARYTEFAFLAAVNDGADAVEALSGYIDAINDEIERKRIEFDLPVLEEGQLEPPTTVTQ